MSDDGSDDKSEASAASDVSDNKNENQNSKPKPTKPASGPPPVKRSTGRVTLPPWLAGKGDQKPATPPWVKKRLSAASLKKKAEATTAAAAEKETDNSNSDPDMQVTPANVEKKTMEREEKTNQGGGKKEEETKPPPPSPPAPPEVRSPPPPPPGSPPSTSDDSGSEESVYSDDLNDDAKDSASGTDEELVSSDTDDDEIDAETDDEMVDTDDEGDLGAETDEEEMVDTDEEGDRGAETSEEEIGVETDDEEMVDAETDGEEELVVGSDDESEHQIFTDDNDTEEDRNQPLALKLQTSKLQAATPEAAQAKVPDNSKQSLFLASSASKAQKPDNDNTHSAPILAQASKPTESQETAKIQPKNVQLQPQQSQAAEDVSLRSAGPTTANLSAGRGPTTSPGLISKTRVSNQISPVSVATSQAVGEPDMNEDHNKQENGNWTPVSTDLLPFGYSAAREMAENPHAFVKSEETDEKESETKNDLSPESMPQHERGLPKRDSDTWMVPRRHDDDSSWVNPIREVDASRRSKLIGDLESSRPGGPLIPRSGDTVSTIGTRSVQGDAQRARSLLGDDLSGMYVEGGISSHAQITEKTWALPSRATSRRSPKDQENKNNEKDYRFSYIAATHTHSTASYSDTVREKYFPNQDNPIWEPSARSYPLGLANYLFAKPGATTESFNDEESWLPPDESELAEDADEDDDDDDAPKSGMSVATSEFDWTPQAAKITRTRRVDFSGRITSDEAEDTSWVPGPQVKANPEQAPQNVQSLASSSGGNRGSDNTSRTQGPGDGRQSGPARTSTRAPNNTQKPESRPPEDNHVVRSAQPVRESRPVDPPLVAGSQPQDDESDSYSSDSDDEIDEEDQPAPFSAPKDMGAESKRYRSRQAPTFDEENPRSSRDAPSSGEFATSASGRIRFQKKPQTILINKDIEAEHGKRRESGGSTVALYMFIVCLLVLVGAGVAVYFFVFKEDDPPLVSNPGGEFPTLSPSLTPNVSPPFSSAPVDKPIDDPNKPPTASAPSPSPPSQPPIPEFGDVLLELLSRVSLDEGAALRDPRSPQHAAMQWIRTPANQGIYRDRIFIQRYALATVYYATGGEQWVSSDGWLTNATICEWYTSSTSSSICDSDGSLLELDLGDNRLVGTLPPEVFLLAGSLEALQLSRNNLFGSIPSALSLLTKLSSLLLSENNFDGGFPADIEKLTDLRQLQLNGNGLRSGLPSSIGELRSLQRLDLSSNRFNGRIPFEMALLGDLEFLSLRDNELIGTIPVQFQSLRNLRFLYVDNNSLEPPVPVPLCDSIELSAFWADCDEIECECCTHCCVDGRDC